MGSKVIHICTVLFIVLGLVYGEEAYDLYSDQMNYGVSPNAFATMDYSHSVIVHSGTKSIKYTPNQAFSFLGFYCNECVNKKMYKSVDFWVHGGTTGGQSVIFSLRINNQSTNHEATDTYVVLDSYFQANNWTKVSISLDSVPLEKYIGVNWRTTGGTQSGTFYIDEIKLVHRYGDLCVDPTPAAMPYVIGYQALYHLAQLDQIDYSKMSHVAVSFIQADATGTLINPYESYLKNDVLRMTLLYIAGKAHLVGTKAILSFGGEGANSPCSDYPIVSPPRRDGPLNNATSNATVGILAENLVNFAKGVRFDGIDLDWEECVDIPGITRLASAIRDLWPEAFITFPAAPLYNWGNPTPPSALVGFMQYVDVLNYMSYIPPHTGGGWYPSWDAIWHISPLTGDAPYHPYSIHKCVNEALTAGIPASKIGIGMAFFGSCWSYPMTQPVGQIVSQVGGRLVPTDNLLTYPIIDSVYKPNMDYNYDTTANVPFLNTSSSGVGSLNCTYISYDDDLSIQAKADFVQDNELAGIIIWTVEQGVTPAGTNPYLDTVHAHFRSAIPTPTAPPAYCGPSSTTGDVFTTTASSTTGQGSTTGDSTTGGSSTTGSPTPTPTPAPDVDECAENTANCSELATCFNTNGDFECVCNEGYAGDGFSCSPSTPDQTCADSIRFRNIFLASWMQDGRQVSQWKVEVRATVLPIYALALSLSLPNDSAPLLSILVNITQRLDGLYVLPSYILSLTKPIPADSVVTFSYLVNGTDPLDISLEESLCALPPKNCSLRAEAAQTGDWSDGVNNYEQYTLQFYHQGVDPTSQANVTVHFTPGKVLSGGPWAMTLAFPQTGTEITTNGQVSFAVNVYGLSPSSSQPYGMGGFILKRSPSLPANDLVAIVDNVICS